MRIWLSFVMGCTLALAGCDNVEILLWQTPEERVASQSDEDPELEAQLDEEEDEDDLPPVEPRTTAETDEQTDTISDPEQPFSDAIDETLVIEDVLILTMTDRGAITGRVIIEEGIIKGVGDDIPLMPDESAVTVIDGNGYTLLPGLADMHTHYWQPEEGILFLANGITTVRNMWGTDIAIRLDEGAKNGAFPGPQVFTPGPLMDGADPFWGERSLVVTSPQMARGAVRAQKAAGFQAIKLHKKIDRQSFEAAVDEAKTQGLQVYTHTPLSMNVRDVLAVGTDSLEHLDGVSAALTNQDAKGTGGTLPISQWSDVSRSQIKPLANAFAKSGVASVPTFTAINTRYQSMLDPDRFFEKPDAAYLTFAVKDWWLETAGTARGELRSQEISSARANQLAFVRALHDAGAELLIGTDSPNPFIVTGFSIHDELQAFREAGIDETEILRIATVGAAKFLGQGDVFGTIAEGMRADLILVKGDPREDLSVLKDPEMVIAGGQAFDRVTLDAFLEEAQDRARNPQ